MMAAATLAVIVSLAPVKQPTASAQSICGCTKAGPYQAASPGLDPQVNPGSSATTGTSPKGKYTLTEQGGNTDPITHQRSPITLTISRPGATPTVLDIPGNSTRAQWGFSPDEDRFVYRWDDGDSSVGFHDTTTLYDLARGCPGLANRGS